MEVHLGSSQGELDWWDKAVMMMFIGLLTICISFIWSLEMELIVATIIPVNL